MDIMMPVMDGLELAEHIHDKHPEIRMMILSGYSDFELARKAIRFGVVDYLLKPVDIQELKATLLKQIDTLDFYQNTIRKVNDREYELRQITASGRNQAVPMEETMELIAGFLEHNYREEISLSGLAEQAGFTVDYLSRQFKKYKKESPVKYLTRIRMEEAKKLLVREASLGIREIGELVGYPDQYYFSRIFKEQTGCQPSEYRKTHRQNQ